LTPEREGGRFGDPRVERGRCLDVADADCDVIDAAPRPLAVAMGSFEAVTGLVLEKRGVVIVGVVRTRAGGPSSVKPASMPACQKRSTCAGVVAMNAMCARRAIGCASSVCVRAKFPQTEKVGVLAVSSLSSSSSTAANAAWAIASWETRRVT
jgi:hypothetical protein